MPELKEVLGEELYKQVTEKAGENKIAIVSDGNWFPKDKFNAVNDEKNTFKSQLKERDEQLKILGKQAEGNEQLQNQIKALQDENKTTNETYQKQLSDQAFNFALKESLTGAKARNPKAVEALLNKENIKLDGDKLIGLDDQLKALQESDAYLFNTEQATPTTPPPAPPFTVGQHQRTGGNGEPQSLHEAIAQSMNAK